HPRGLLEPPTPTWLVQRIDSVMASYAGIWQSEANTFRTTERLKPDVRFIPSESLTFTALFGQTAHTTFGEAAMAVYRTVVARSTGQAQSWIAVVLLGAPVVTLQQWFSAIANEMEGSFQPAARLRQDVR